VCTLQAQSYHPSLTVPFSRKFFPAGPFWLKSRLMNPQPTTRTYLRAVSSAAGAPSSQFKGSSKFSAAQFKSLHWRVFLYNFGLKTRIKKCLRDYFLSNHYTGSFVIKCQDAVETTLNFFWPNSPPPPSGPWPPHSRGFQIAYNDAQHSVGLLWTSDQPVAQTSTWQHTTLTTDKHPCPRWDSNPQSQPQTHAWDDAATGTGHLHL